MSDFTTTALVAGTKRRAYLPSGTGLTTGQILQYLTDEMGSSLMGFLKGIREEYSVTSVDLTVTSDHVVAPARAVGAAFRTIKWVQGDGRAYQLNRIEPERVPEYAVSASLPTGYVFEGNDLILIPSVTSGTIRLAYQLRPGTLVLPNACGLITALDTGTGLITLALKPATFVSGATFDLVSSTANFVALAMDQTATQDSSTTMTINPLPARLAVGDYVCLAGETCIAPFATEVHALLAQMGAAKIAQSTGSARADQIAKGLTDLKKDLTMVLSPRSDGSSRPIVSRSRLGRRF